VNRLLEQWNHAKNISQMGLHIDGVYVAPLGVQTGLEVACLIFVVAHLLFTTGILVHWIINRSQFNKNTLSYHVIGLIFGGIIWQVNQIIFLYLDQTFISHWIHGYLAPFLMLIHFYLQLEIVAAFSIANSVLSVKSVKRIRIGVSLWWFITTGCYLAMIPYLGSPFPAVVNMWFAFGYPLFIVSLIFYDTFQSIYILYSIKRMVTNKAKLLQSPSTHAQSSIVSVETTKTKEYEIAGLKKMVLLVSIAILIDWTATISTIMSLQIPQPKERTIINVFASSIAFFHIDLVAFILTTIKQVKVVRSTVNTAMNTRSITSHGG
jgi:hypothetical protein